MCVSAAGGGVQLQHQQTDGQTNRRRVLVALTLAVTQVLDLNALLFLTGRFLHLAGVVIGTAVRGAHRVEADVGAVDVANTPAEREMARRGKLPSSLISEPCHHAK